MTEKERVKSTYEKVRKKYPDIVDETKITELAFKAQQRRTLWISLAFLWSSMLLMVAYILIPDTDYTGTVLGCCLTFFIVCSFEYFRTVLNSSKIKYHYYGEGNVKPQGVLTYEKIAGDKKLSSKNGVKSFKIVKATLCDKEDTDDSYVSFIYHKYNLYFKLDNDCNTVGFRVKRKFYLTAPLDAEYLLVLSDDGKVVSAYLSKAWGIESQLSNYCEFNVNEHNMIYQTSCGSEEAAASRKELPFEIVVFVLNLVSYLLSLALCTVVLPFTTFFATEFAIRNKNAFSVINVIAGYGSIVFATLFIPIL